MSVIPPSLPPSGSDQVNPYAPHVPTAPAPITTTSVASQIVQDAATRVDTPQLPLATYFGVVADSILAKKIQDILDALSDPAKSAELWQATQNQAERSAILLSNAYQYKLYQNKLNKLNLSQKTDTLNQHINDFNTTWGPQDAAQTDALSTKIIALNNARAGYELALQNYNTAVLNYNVDLNNYNAAVQTYEQALSDYQNGFISEAQLRTAESSFNSAKATFDAAQSNFSTQKIIFDLAALEYTTAHTALNNQITIFNNYATLRQAAVDSLNQEIHDYNSDIAIARDLISKMNTLRVTFFNQPEFALPNPVSIPEDLPLYNLPPPQIGTIYTTVQANINANNNLSENTINPTIISADARISAINANPLFNPKLNPIPSVSSIDSPAPLYPILNHLDPPILPSPTSYTSPPDQDFVTPNLGPIADSMNLISNLLRRIRRLEEDTQGDTPVIRGRIRPTFIGAPGASIALASMTNTANKEVSSPFLERQLSRQAFEAYFNINGVPLSSQFVDQIGSLFDRVSTLAGLVSAVDAKKILGNATVTGVTGTLALNVATALGNLNQLQGFLLSGRIREFISRLIIDDPTLSSLSEEAKAQLINGISQEVGASLLKKALRELAQALNMPGLMPEILAQLPGASEDPLASLTEQLFKTFILADELSKISPLDTSEVERIAREALDQTGGNLISAKDRIVEYILGEIEKSIEGSVDLERKILLAIEATQERINTENLRTERRRLDDLRNQIAYQLEALEIDPSRAAQVAGVVSLNSPDAAKNSLSNELKRKNIFLTEFEIAQIVANTFIALNPLGSFLIDKTGATTETSALFKAQVLNTLSPVAGIKHAEQVSEDYGRLIFTTANSILTTLTENEKEVLKLAGLDKDARLYENYRDATYAYLNPQEADDSPLKLGKTLLLSGLGITNQDNVLGPLGNRSKHATSVDFGIMG